VQFAGGVSTVKDRIVQRAVRLAIEPIFEADFRDESYGFRLGRGCHGALREVDLLIRQGYAHMVDADPAGYFGSILHAEPLKCVARRIVDARKR
jgi:RNA-directed DNA polymerase